MFHGKAVKDHQKDYTRAFTTDIINEFDNEFEWISLQYALTNNELELLTNNKKYSPLWDRNWKL